MKLKGWTISKTPDPETEVPRVSLTVKIIEFETEEDADELLRAFKEQIVKAGGQTTLDSDVKEE